MTKPTKRMRALHEYLSALLADVEAQFSEPVKVTLLVRNAMHPDGSRDVHLTNDDDTEEAIEAIRRVLSTGVHTGGPAIDGGV